MATDMSSGLGREEGRKPLDCKGVLFHLANLNEISKIKKLKLNIKFKNQQMI